MQFSKVFQASGAAGRGSRRYVVALAALSALSLAACGQQQDLPSESLTGGSNGGSKSTSSGGGATGSAAGATGGSSSGQAGATSGGGIASTSVGGGGSTASGGGGDGTGLTEAGAGGGGDTSGVSGGVLSSDGGTGGTAGNTGSHTLDHCLYGYDPDPTDSDPNMKDGPSDFYPPGNMDPSIVDTTVQPQVLNWMQTNHWEDAHVEWHAIRACNIPGGGGMASHVNICSYTQLIPKDQNCQTAGDGYQFLVFHRHMIQALKQLWPHHTEQFSAFAKFPTSAADVPAEWRSAWKDWDSDALAAGQIGDAIDKPENLARFPDEGTLGFWLQCNVGQKLTTPTNNMPWVGIHFALHAKWARPGNTTHGVNNTNANIDNYMFWKLHGWIDNVWERYRVAKGMMPTDQKLKDDLVQQCREMDTEIQIIKNTKKDGGTGPDPGAPLPVESGFFHEKVRPIFESQKNLCSGCHAESGAYANLTLGGHISSADIVNGLVNRPSNDGGQYKIVVPGDPDHSWLYLKAAGKAATANCMASTTAQCITGVMPPSSGGPTVTATDLQTIRQWIMDGAAGPPAASN